MIVPSNQSSASKRSSFLKIIDKEIINNVESNKNHNNVINKTSDYIKINDFQQQIQSSPPLQSQQNPTNQEKSPNSQEKKKKLEAQFLTDFSRYLQKKYSEKKQKRQYNNNNSLNNSNDEVVELVQCKDEDDIKSQQNRLNQNNRQERIQNELRRKLKLYSKTKEAKFNEIFDVFKGLDTFIDIKPFLHDLNLVNNSKMYQTIQDLKHRIAEKKSSQEVEFMLEQVKENIQKQEKEQEEEDKILHRGLKQFVQNSQLLEDSSKYVMNWRKNHKIQTGIMTDQLVDHLRIKKTTYQELVDQNDPDLDAHQFYDQLNKQLFKQKGSFKKLDLGKVNKINDKTNNNQENPEKQNVNSNQQTQQQIQLQSQSQLHDLIDKQRKRIQSEDENITEEEKLKRAQESLRTRLLTIDGFDKENQSFSDQMYFTTYQQKAQIIRKNLQKATQSTFKHKWANANVKLKKLREDEYNQIMKKINQSKSIQYQNLQFPSKQSFQTVFQGKVIESPVAKIYNSNSSPKQNKPKQTRKSIFTNTNDNNLNINSNVNDNLTKDSGSSKMSESNYSNSNKDQQQYQTTFDHILTTNPDNIDHSYDYANGCTCNNRFSDDEENNNDTDRYNVDEDEEDQDDDDGSEKYTLSKKWHQLQRDQRLSRSGSVASNFNQRHYCKVHSSNKNHLENNNNNGKSLFHQTQGNHNQSNQQQQNDNLSQLSKQFLTHRKLSHKLFGNSSPTASNQSIQFNHSKNNNNNYNSSFHPQSTTINDNSSLSNRYFFPSNNNNNNNNNNKKQQQQNYSTTLNKISNTKRNINFNTSRKYSENNKDLSSRQYSNNISLQQSNKQLMKNTKSDGNFNLSYRGKQQQNHHSSTQNNNSRHNLEDNKIQIENESQKNSVGGCHNPPSTPSIRLLNTNNHNNKDFLKKQTENYKAVEKQLMNIKFSKFLKDIEANQFKFGLTRERYEIKINQIQKKFENEITKFENPKLDIYQSVNLYDDNLRPYQRGKMINNRTLGHAIS